MLWTRSAWSAGKLTRCALILELVGILTGRPLGTRCETAGTVAGTTLPATVEDRSAALNACRIGSSCRSSRGRRRWRSFIDGARPGLGHDHLARLDYDWLRGCDYSFRRRSFRHLRNGGSRAIAGLRRRSFDCRRSFRSRSGRRFGWFSNRGSRPRGSGGGNDNLGRFCDLDWRRSLDFRLR
jgi:hypothetical protein